MLNAGLPSAESSLATQATASPPVQDLVPPGSKSSLGRFGEYELIEEIARGGMGVVYKARQVSLDRIVALKMILFGSLASAEQVRRFRIEASAAGSLQHPNIVAVHEVGLHEGQNFLVMDYVDGPNLARFIQDRPLPVKQAASYLKTIAEAIHYAHERRIMHRDLKPSNVLIGSDDRPRVTDFGLAKRFDSDSSLTLTGQVLGSPNYMPPEQAGQGAGKVGRRSDVYSLGAILYHLLTGRPPFRADTLTDTLRQVHDSEPLSPRLLNSSVPSDLETICLMCLAKEPAKRFASAQELAEDLDRFLKNEPIRARPVGRAERVWRWCRRKPALAGALTTAAILLFAVLVGSPIAAYRINQAREAAVKSQTTAKAEAARAATSAYAANMLLAQADWDNNSIAHVRQVLAETRDYPDRGFEWYYWQRQCHSESRTLYGHLAAVRCVVISPDGELIVTASVDNTARVWDASTGRELFRLKGQTAGIYAVAFSPDGTRIVAGAAGNVVRLWDARTGGELFSFSAHRSSILSVAFSPDGTRILTASDSDKTAKVWETSTGRLLLSFEGRNYEFNSVAFSPDGQRIVSGGVYPTVKVWGASTGDNLLTLKGRTDGFQSITVAWSPDGQWIVGGSRDNTAQVWDATTGRQLVTFEGHTKRIYIGSYTHGAGIIAVAFSPDSRWIVTGSSDNTAKVWEASTGRELRTLKGHTAMISSVAWSRDGRRIVTGSEDSTAKVWEAGTGGELLTLEGNTKGITAIDFSSDDRLIVTGTADNKVEVWEADTGNKLLAVTNHTGSIRAVAFSPDCRWVVSGSEDNTAKIWQLDTKHEPVTLRGHNAWVRCVAFSPDGLCVATGSNDKTARLWAANTGQELDTFSGHSGIIFSLAFSRDGKFLVTGSGDKTAKVFEVSSRSQLHTLTGHTDAITSATFSPDGRRIVTGSQDKTAKLWETITGRELATLRGHTENVCSVVFSRDGQRVVTGSWDRTARLWEATTCHELLRLSGQPALEESSSAAPVVGLGFFADGQRIVTGNSDNTIKVWTRASDEEVTAWLEQERLGTERLAAQAMEQEQERAARAADERAVREWLILAPIPLTKGETGLQGFNRSQAHGEAELKPRAGDRTLINGNEFVWFEAHMSDDAIDFNQLLGEQREYCVAYAVSYIIAENPETDLRMKIGSDDEAKVYLNSKQVYEWPSPRSFVANSDEVTGLQLNKGTNVLILKVLNEGMDWRGSVRLTDKDGNPVKGVRVTLRP